MGPNSTGLGVSHSELLYQHFSIRLSFYWTFFFGNFSNLVLKKKFLQLLSNRYWLHGWRICISLPAILKSPAYHGGGPCEKTPGLNISPSGFASWFYRAPVMLPVTHRYLQVWLCCWVLPKVLQLRRDPRETFQSCRHPNLKPFLRTWLQIKLSGLAYNKVLAS